MRKFQYIFEIRGCNFKNKGDVLMAESVISYFSSHRPDIGLVSRTFNRRKSLADPSKLGRCLSPRHTNNQSPLKALGLKAASSPFISVALEKCSGLVPASGIDGIIDVCGFSYGDSWGPAAIEADHRFYSEAASRGKTIILMPKSFGPFSDPQLAAKMRDICNLATLCFARDGESFQHLIHAGVQENWISRFPDFTEAAKPIILEKYKHLKGRPALIPNYRMIDTGRRFSEPDYINFLAELYKLLEGRFGKPYMLIHDIGRDTLLSQGISARLGINIETINEPVARANKGIISTASLVYSDRLHGAISAALQSVPVITMGWSHKYFYMLKDFGLEWAQIKDNSISQALGSLEQILQRYINSAIELNAAREDKLSALKDANLQMWNLIFEKIGARHPPAR